MVRWGIVQIFLHVLCLVTLVRTWKNMRDCQLYCTKCCRGSVAVYGTYAAPLLYFRASPFLMRLSSPHLYEVGQYVLQMGNRSPEWLTVLPNVTQEACGRKGNWNWFSWVTGKSLGPFFPPLPPQCGFLSREVELWECLPVGFKMGWWIF